MSAKSIVSLRPKYLGRLALGVAALGALIAVIATARAAQVRDHAPPEAPLAEPIAVDRQDPIDPLWTLEAAPVQRAGYRGGRRQVLEVVPLGPGAVEVEVNTARAFLMMRAAAADAGIDLGLASGFRTVEEQRALFRAWRKGRGNKAARPGMSNHQSGRALDIAGVMAPGALAWLDTNAAQFGFKRTVKSEPWHWEYVDSPIARGATKRVSRKSAKRPKAVGHARRPAQRPKLNGKALRTSGARVASSRR